MPAANRILLIDDQASMCRMVDTLLSASGYRVTPYTVPLEAVQAYRPGAFDLVITDVKMPGLDGMEVLERIRARDPAVPVIMITAHATLELSIQALRRGAYDLLIKPFEPEELRHRVRNALRQTELVAENRELREELEGKARIGSLVGEAPALLAVLETAAKVARRDVPVLITGESGTGKELVAQAIHQHSGRRDAKFVAINCGALPQSLLESELFGFRKGAFTGADREHRGLLQVADRGTLFLDEVGNLPLEVQKALLRFLQEQEFYRVGDTRPQKVDVRLVSATNVDLQAAVAQGELREDLYYRLNVVNLHVPPLRERRSDIPLLVAHFVREQNARFGTHVQGFTPEAMDAADRFGWPGNVRQLRNVVEASLAVSSGEYIGAEVLRQFIRLPAGDEAPAAPEAVEYAAALARFETAYLRRLLARTGGNVEAAAAAAKMNVTTIYRKLKRHGLSREGHGPS